MASIEIRVDDAEIQRGLGELVTRLRNFEPAFKNIGEYLTGSVDERFRTERDPDGQAWAPLARATLKRKQQTGGILKILQERGRLRDSIVYRAGPDGVEVGTNVVYAAIHQFGGEIKQYAQSRYQEVKIDKKTGRQRFAKKGKGNFEQRATFGDRTINMPARPYLGINQTDRQAILRILNSHLSGDLS